MSQKDPTSGFIIDGGRIEGHWSRSSVRLEGGVLLPGFELKDSQLNNQEQNGMAKRAPKKASEDSSKETDRVLAKWGITRIPMDDRFQFGSYQYSSLEHAVAQAKREKATTKG